MAFFNDFKEKFTNAAHSVSNKTKDSIEITRISSEIRSLEEKITNLYTDLGRNYYASAGKEGCDAICRRIDELREKINEMDQRRIQLRNQNRCPACGAVMNESARFCSNCGRRMPEPEVAAEPAPEVENTEFCPECGAMRKESTPFCDICGHEFESQKETAGEDASSKDAVPEDEAPKDEVSEDEAPSHFDAE